MVPEEKMKSENDGNGPALAVAPTAPPLIDPLARVAAALHEFGRTSGLDAKKLDQLRTLIMGAVDERVSEVQDIKIGRVLGSALAML